MLASYFVDNILAPAAIGLLIGSIIGFISTGGR